MLQLFHTMFDLVLLLCTVCGTETIVCIFCRVAVSAGISDAAAGGGGAATSPAGADGDGKRLPADQPEGGAAQPDTAARQLPGSGQHKHRVKSIKKHALFSMVHSV